MCVNCVPGPHRRRPASPADLPMISFHNLDNCVKAIVENALDVATARGATGAEVRLVELKKEEIEMQDRVPSKLTFDESQGIGIKIYTENGWGFASTNEVEPAEIERVVSRAIALAQAHRRPLSLPRVPEPAHVDKWVLPIHQDPFEISVEEKLRLLDEINSSCLKVRGIQTVYSSMAFERRRQLFANLEGSRIEQLSYLSGVGYVVVASNGAERQIRSYPNSFGGQYAAAGYELIYHWPLLENAQRIAEEAVALLDAPDCPSRECDLILDGSQLALQIHESCGQPAELDRVLGYETNFAGTSFLTPAHRRQLKYSSNIVNIYADARPDRFAGAGTFAYDDEGVQAQRTDIVKDGCFVNFLTSRDLAGAVQDERSNGCVRASGWNRAPLIRMTNICLAPHEGTLDQLIADTKDGIYMKTNKSWSIDDRRYNFQFGTELAWEVKNGHKTRMLKNPTYGGTTTRFWQSCDAICGNAEWELWGIPNCGKGQPEQILAVSHGASPARFRRVKIGVGDVE